MAIRPLARGGLAAALLAFAPTVVTAQILEVPTQFPTIQAAVDAAPDGASITVLPGNYAPFEIVGKSLSIHGAGAGLVNVGPGVFTEPGISIRDVPPFGDVVVSGVTVHAKGQSSLVWVLARTIEVRDSLGTVFFSGVETGAAPASEYLEAGLHVEHSSLVIVDASTIRGGDGGPAYAGSASPAIQLISSAVWVSNSTVEAGDHLPQSCVGAPGRPGIQAAPGSTIHIAASEIRGGRGGTGTDWLGLCGGFGGVGGSADRRSG